MAVKHEEGKRIRGRRGPDEKKGELRKGRRVNNFAASLRRVRIIVLFDFSYSIAAPIGAHLNNQPRMHSGLIVEMGPDWRVCDPDRPVTSY
jgi:hypothetical protein